MAYEKPNVFVNIQIAEPAVAASTPAFYPVMIAPHFFVAYKEQVEQSGKDYYDKLGLEGIAYPGLPNESVDTNNSLSVDVGDLTPNANDAQGSPNTEPFDPDVFIVTQDGVEVDVSLAEGLLVTASDFDLPANMVYDPSTGDYSQTLGDLTDNDMSAAGTADWTPISTTNDPTLAKDGGQADYNTTQALSVTLHATPDIGDGVMSSGFTVVPGDNWRARIRAKTAAVTYTLQVWDVTNSAVITETTGLTNTDYATTTMDFTVPDNCQSVAIRQITETATGGEILYLGSAHLLYMEDSALQGQILVSYRALEEKYSGARLQKLEASTLAELQDLFGQHGLGPSNPLGFMMYQAWIHTNLPVRGVAVGNPATNDGSSSYTGSVTDELQSYAAAFDFIEQNPDDYYAWALATSNEAVWDAMLARLQTLEGTNRHWARGFVGGDISTMSTFLQGSDGVLYGMFDSATVGGFTDGDTITYNGTDYTVRVVDGQAYVALPLAADTAAISFTYNATQYNDGAFVVDDGVGVMQAFSSAEAPAFTGSGYTRVKVNDTLTIGDGEYTVQSVRSDLLVVSFSSGTEAGGGFNKSFTVYRYLTSDGTVTGTPDKTTMAQMAGSRAEAYADDRLVIVLPGFVSANVQGEFIDVNSWYAAAQLAAEVCYQVDIANNRGPGYPVGLGFTGLREAQSNVFRSVRYFSEAQLDTIADGGNLLLVNDNPGEVLYARHSLTTDRGSVETQEIMLAVSRDYVAYTYKNTLNSLVQRYRLAGALTPALKMRLEAVKRRLTDTERVVQTINITDIKSGETPDALAVSGTMSHVYPLNKIGINLDVVQPVPFTVTL